MRARWGSYICLIGFLALLVGCRTPQPVLKPEKPPEQLTMPTNEPRYDTSEYPKLAFDKNDPSRITSLEKGTASTNRVGMPGGMGMAGR